MAGYPHGKYLLDPERHKAVVSKEKQCDHECVEENVASSSRSNLGSFLVGMRFLPSLANKILQEDGDGDSDVFLRRLFQDTMACLMKRRAVVKRLHLFNQKSQKQAYLLFACKVSDMLDEFHVDKREALLMMNFSESEVNFALGKLCEDVPVDEIVDFITATQTVEEHEKKADDLPSDAEECDQEAINENLFGIMGKTLCLLEMGFSEADISLAIEKYGAETPILQLADSILTGCIAGNCSRIEKSALRQSRKAAGNSRSLGRQEKNASYDAGDVSQTMNTALGESRKGKRPREVFVNDFSVAVSRSRRMDYDETQKGKSPAEEYMDEVGSFLEPPDLEEKVDTVITGFRIPAALNSNSRNVDTRLAKPPYFFYGSVVNLPTDCWDKISKFLNGIEPEFVDTQSFSALSRIEGYIHNLPISNRSNIPRTAPMTIQYAIPHTKKWWPSWDTRKKLTCISTETDGVPELCSSLEKMVSDSEGHPSSEQQREILCNCKTSNLIWIGQYKLGPVDPEHWEHILGYPLYHTRATEHTKTERLQALKTCFQTDTLGYYLSVLKSMYPEGLTVLSIFSGIGGAEVTLHLLGIPLKGIVSVETSEPRRRILRRWWQTTKQTGELVEIENIQLLRINNLETLFAKFGGFDLVICQNPCTISKPSAKMAANGENHPTFDFALFHEFVRVLQRVKSMMAIKK